MMYQGGAVQVLQDFTDDRDRLREHHRDPDRRRRPGLGETPRNDASSADTGAAFGQDDSEFNIFNTDRQLAALQTAANMLGKLNEKKSLIYFASGLRLNGVDNQAQLHATINAAIRAGVSFWPIDARGLVAQAPLGDATQGSPGGIGMYNGASALAVTRQLPAVAGHAVRAGRRYRRQSAARLQRSGQGNRAGAASHFQLLHHRLLHHQRGARRQIPPHQDHAERTACPASLDYRQGYFAGKQFGKFTAADKERQLEDALMLGDPITELTIAMEVDYFQLNRAEYFVPVVVKIPGSELALAKRGGAEHTLHRFHRRSQGRFRHHRHATCATRSTSS